jgi:hypothetical protein
MDEDNTCDNDAANQPKYKPMSEIDPSALREALCKLNLLGDDLFLRMQAFNLMIVDGFISELEAGVLDRLITEERTPVPEAAFLAAQSQMWIFAAYELLRTWRQRAGDIIKWHENGGLELKLKVLEEDVGYSHIGRSSRAAQIRKVLAEPSLISAIRQDIRRTHILFVRLEAIRISLAKHELRRQSGSVALAPGHGRINQWCGSLDYELENGQYSMGYINRRDIADEIRALLITNIIPTDDEIASFEEFMRGPTEMPFSGRE